MALHHSMRINKTYLNYKENKACYHFSNFYLDIIQVKKSKGFIEICTTRDEKNKNDNCKVNNLKIILIKTKISVCYYWHEWPQTNYSNLSAVFFFILCQYHEKFRTFFVKNNFTFSFFSITKGKITENELEL